MRATKVIGEMVSVTICATCSTYRSQKTNTRNGYMTLGAVTFDLVSAINIVRWNRGSRICLLYPATRMVVEIGDSVTGFG